MHRLTLEAVPVTLLLPEVLDVEEQGRCGLLSCWAPYSGTLDAPCLAALPSLLDKEIWGWDQISPSLELG